MLCFGLSCWAAATSGWPSLQIGSTVVAAKFIQCCAVVRGAQVSGARFPRQLNFACRHLIFGVCTVWILVYVTLLAPEILR